MEDILEFIYTIATALGLFIIWRLYKAITCMIIGIKYSTIIKVFKRYGYRFFSTYNDKGKGLIYRKQMVKFITDSLLIRFNYEPIDLCCQYKVFDYIAIIKYPYWVDNIYDTFYYPHGGYFYMLEVQIGDTFYQRPFHKYFDNDRAGESIKEMLSNDMDYLESIVSDTPIHTFYTEEIKYWKEHELLKQTKNE